MSIKQKVKNLIVDSGAFILRSPIQDYGENIFTISDVVGEIKDESTREALQVLPYELKYREPTEDDVKFVANFAKRTGDFNQLSVTDIRLLALVVRLEKEINNGINLKEAPAQLQVLPTKSVGQNNKVMAIRDMEFFGYDVKNKHQIKKDDNQNELSNDERENKNMQTQESNDQTRSESNKLGNDIASDEENNDYDDSDLIGEDEGWITKENCEEVRRKLMGIKFEDEDDIPVNVACITGDYAMQNVLLQMGLNVISPRDGLHIRQTRQFVLRCYACCKINPPTANQFCKFCGNMKTLKRVSVTVNQDGTTKVHINFNKPINIRGTKYSLPMPRPGRHANNPILCEDQQVPQQRKSKLAVLEKKQLTIKSILNDPDYLVRSNPFSVNDVYSRASRVTTHQRKVINPNETRKPTGNRKKKNRHI
ncbi:hypothetical protein RDWZM_006070 [Blomia tropicalis]|uniref:RNA-binding protein NOB1 n=1 Tax=Blomia tropicalis TaxID=40697 RepID=A0A9Q0M7Z9_BLOTA|nr:hypothetical protein RDWZM_006070 [Blomia tropicalis]